MNREIKWFQPDSENGSLKQHAFVAKECKERFTLYPYPGNNALCGMGFISDDGEYALSFDEIEGEVLKESKACKKCLKIVLSTPELLNL